MRKKKNQIATYGSRHWVLIMQKSSGGEEMRESSRPNGE